MGILKTHLLALFVAATGPASAAPPLDVAEQARIFAECAGRYSAIVEHDWLMRRAEASDRRRRDAFRALLDAVWFDARDAGIPTARMTDQRIVAKQAQARLLHMATFHTDRRIARRAALRADRARRLCDMLLPG